MLGENTLRTTVTSWWLPKSVWNELVQWKMQLMQVPHRCTWTWKRGVDSFINEELFSFTTYSWTEVRIKLWVSFSKAVILVILTSSRKTMWPNWLRCLLMIGLFFLCVSRATLLSWGFTSYCNAIAFVSLLPAAPASVLTPYLDWATPWLAEPWPIWETSCGTRPCALPLPLAAPSSWSFRLCLTPSPAFPNDFSWWLTRLLYSFIQ